MLERTKVMDLFPTKVWEYQVTDDKLLHALLEEIHEKEPLIRKISSTAENQSPNKYATDYTAPVQLENFEKIMKELIKDIESNGLIAKLSKYWTALYKQGSFHVVHHHHLSLFDDTNMSGILYLTNLGGTLLFANSPTAFETHAELPAAFGKIILFPAQLMHEVAIGNPSEENQRIVVPFNMNVLTDESLSVYQFD